MTPPPSDDHARWRTMDGTERPPAGAECELLLPDGEIIRGAVFDPDIRNWRFEVPEHLRNRTLYISGWRPTKK